MITIVLNSLARGGAERSVLILLEGLIRRGMAAQLVCLREVEKQYDLPEIIAPHVIRLRAPDYPRAAAALISHIRLTTPSILYAMMPQASLIAVMAGALTGVRVVTSERTTPTLFYTNAAKRTLALTPHALASQTIFISRYALDNGLPRGLLGKRIRGRAAVLHNPVPVEMPLPHAVERRAQRLARLDAALNGRSDRPLSILLASRLVAGKGLESFLVQAEPWLRRTGSIVRIAGTGPLEDRIAALAGSLGLGEQVVMRGFVSDMEGEYDAVDVVALPSESEGFGRVGFEAYQCGALVVGTPRNSFHAEILTAAPAWTTVETFSGLPDAMRQLNLAAPGSADDIIAMREALSPETHVQRFLDIIGSADHA